MESIYVGQLLLGMKPALEDDVYTERHSIEEKWFSLSQQVSIANNLLGRAGASCLLPLPPSPCSML